MKKQIILAGLVLVITTSFSFVLVQEDPWKVPEKYEKLKNPVIADESSISAGQEIYKSYCPNCHGLNGKGAGKRSVNLDIPPSNFTTEAFQKQTDGALLYKIYFGHKEMPGFERKLPGTKGLNDGGFGKTRSAGDLINYIRTFGK